MTCHPMNMNQTSQKVFRSSFLMVQSWSLGHFRRHGIYAHIMCAHYIVHRSKANTQHSKRKHPSAIKMAHIKGLCAGSTRVTKFVWHVGVRLTRLCACVRTFKACECMTRCHASQSMWWAGVCTWWTTGTTCRSSSTISWLNGAAGIKMSWGRNSWISIPWLFPSSFLRVGTWCESTRVWHTHARCRTAHIELCVVVFNIFCATMNRLKF